MRVRGIYNATEESLSDKQPQELQMNSLGHLKVDTGASDNGPGSPIIDSYSSAVIDVAATQTDSVIVAAPGANKQIWVYSIVALTDADGSVFFESGTSTAKTGTMPIAANGGIATHPSGNFAMPLFKCGTNEALTLTNGAGTIDGVVSYAIVSV